jgi:Flp pilus assembly protein TadD
MRSISPLLCHLTIALLISGCSGMSATQDGATASLPIFGSTSAKDPKLAQALHSVHQLYKQNKLKQAKLQLQKLIEAYPKQAVPHINMGIIQLSENDAQAAEQSFKEALKINQRSAVAQNQLGIALRMQGRFNEAEQAYQAALKYQPSYQLAHRNLGILYDLYLAKPELALKHYQDYQTLAGTKDQEIENWIADLQRRVGK